VYHFWHDRKKCCVLSRLPRIPTAHLRISSSSRGKRSVRYWRTILHQTDHSRNETSSLCLRFASCSPRLITFSLLILVVLLRLVRLRLRSILRFLPLLPCSSPARSQLAMEVPPSPSRLFPLLQRRRTFPRNRSTVHQFRRDMVARSLEENYRVQR